MKPGADPQVTINGEDYVMAGSVVILGKKAIRLVPVGGADEEDDSSVVT